MDSDAYKGAAFLQQLQKYSGEPETKIASAAVRISAENLKLVGLTTMNPKAQVVTISAVAVRKAMHGAGLATKDETLRCLIAFAKLGSTLAIGAAAAPVTFGASAYIAIAVSAVEGYDLGAACFNNGGVVSHTIGVVP